MGLRGVDPRVEQKLVQISEGVFVEGDVLRVVEKIQLYDENLSVQWLDDRHPDFTIGDPPYRIVESCPDGLLRPVMTCWELDERVLERLKAADHQQSDVLAALDNVNTRAKDLEKRRYRDDTSALSEMVRSILASPKDTYKAKNPLTGVERTFRSLPHADDRKPRGDDGYPDTNGG
jgi:hypothetical protein